MLTAAGKALGMEGPRDDHNLTHECYAPSSERCSPNSKYQGYWEALETEITQAYLGGTISLFFDDGDLSLGLLSAEI